jgi:hypothetical protein
MIAPFLPLDFLRAVRTAQIIDRDRLRAQAIKIVLVWLLSYADADGMAWPSLATLAEVSCLSVSTISRAIVAARELGWVTTSRRTRTAVTVYTLHVPATGHGAKSQEANSHDATSQDDRCDTSPGPVRHVMVTGATRHGDQRSVHLSAQPSAQPTAVPATGHGAKSQEAPPRRRLPPGVIAHEATFWIAAYVRGASKALGFEYVFPSAEFGVDVTLADIIGARCPDKANVEPWLEATVFDFAKSVDEEARALRGLGPKGLLAWLNGGKPGSAEAARERRRLEREDPMRQPAQPAADAASPEVAAKYIESIRGLLKDAGVPPWERPSATPTSSPATQPMPDTQKQARVDEQLARVKAMEAEWAEEQPK